VAYMNHSPSRGVTESASAYPTAAIKSSKIALKLKEKVLFFDVADLTVIEAQGNYILLRRRSSCYRLRESISQVVEKLKPHGFIRIHRSVLVNASFVEEIRPQSTGQYSLRVTGGKEYQVTRKYKDNLRCIAQLWIGTGGSSLQN
jgi:DNA-binding LytR/AlgR family response regulator